MAPRLFRRRRQRTIDRLTLGLGVVALGTAGTVVATELVRLARWRAAEEEAPAPDAAQPDDLPLAGGYAPDNPGIAGDAVAVVVGGYRATPRHETVLFNLLSGFLGAFALMRVSTAGIRAGWWPLGNVRVGGRHIHHFVPGILIAFASGSAAVLTQNERLEESLAIPLGAGMGMTLDEAALLLDLRDVYWTPEGILSVQLSLGALALMGGTILAFRILRRGEERAGLEPPA